MPLFANARAVERTFYEQTRIFPIAHLVVMRRDVYERDRSIADSSIAACGGQGLALKRMHKGTRSCCRGAQ
jgi:4,5-dihydroxyphthalate decarboxylase